MESITRPRFIVLIGMLLVLIAVEAGLRVQMISRSEIISQDGTLFLRAGKLLFVNPTHAMYKFGIHPGYPASIAAVHYLLTGNNDPGNDPYWEQAGITISLAASVLAIVAVWTFGAMIFRDVWIGYFGAILLGLGRKFAVTGADVLSDSLMLCFAMWGLVAALQAWRAMEARRKTALLWAAAAGLASAAAYWVRPEGFVVLCIAATTWLGMQIRRRVSWPLTVGMILLAGLAAVAAAAPYGFTNKWRLAEFTALPSAGSSMLTAWLGANELAPTPAMLRFVGRFFEAQHPILASLTCLYLVLWCAARTRRGVKLREALPAITSAGGAMIVILFVWIIPPIVMRYWSTGALSHRYLFLPAAMLAGAPVAAIFCLARLAATRATSEPSARRIRLWIPLAVILGLAIGLSAHTLRPTRSNHLFAKNAGLWLAERIQPGEGLLTDHYCVGYYSRTNRFHIVEDSAMKYYLTKIKPGMSAGQYIRSRLDEPAGYRYVALIRQDGPTLLNDVSDLLADYGYRVVQEFPYIDNGKPRPEKRSILMFERFPATTAPTTRKATP